MLTFIRSLAAATLFAFLSFGAASAQTADRTGIEQVITGQIEAFRADDAAKAYSFASPTIQQKFKTPDFFMSMVARGYPQVYRPQSFAFRETVERGGITFQQVEVLGPKGARVMAVYEMIRLNGKWRINGCFIAKLPGTEV